ncbi:MAG: efflux RND transporter periplasmic adaptor subunit [Balneolaceae bacterium]|nr:efflux RND transporter periplasmic adaptor subunit [Balneolaceae bacterium]
MKTLSNSIRWMTLLLFISLVGCNNQQTGEASHDDHAEEEEHAEETMEVELTSRQLDAVGIETGSFSRLPLQNSVKANGILELPPQNKADVSSLVPGSIRSIEVIEGDRVAKGEVLAELEDLSIIDLQQNYVEASERLAYLEQDYERKKRLMDEGVGSQREFQQASSEYNSTRAKTSAVKGKLELLGLNPAEVREGMIKTSVPIRAPLEGFVRKVEVNTGSFVTPGQHLFEIVDNHHIHIDLMVYEKDLHKVRDDQIVKFRYTNQPDDKLYEARIFAVGKAFEQEPKAVQVHAELTNRQPDLLPGMYVEAWIVTDSTQVLALPEGAVVSDSGSSYIFIREHEEEHATVEQVSDSDEHEHGSRFKAMEVITGVTDKGYVEIKLLQDLPEDTEVVTNGAFFILSEMKKGEGGHHH